MRCRFILLCTLYLPQQASSLQTIRLSLRSFTHISTTRQLIGGMQLSSPLAIAEPCPDRVHVLLLSLPSLDSALQAESTSILSDFYDKRDEGTVASTTEATTEDATTTLAKAAVRAAAVFLKMSSTNNSLKTRKELERAASDILVDSASLASTFSLSLVLATLALPPVPYEDQSIVRSAASAISSMLGSTKGKTPAGKVTELVHSLISMSTSSSNTDLYSLTALARSLNVNSVLNEQVAKQAAVIVERFLHVKRDDAIGSNFPVDARKLDAAAVFAFAVQLSPWDELAPAFLVDIAVRLDLWHAAEKICTSVLSSHGKTSHKTVHAVQTLIDAAFDSRTYRRADGYATQFFVCGGESRFLEARFLHACDTIVKVVRKRALPVIERQVDRVDKAVRQVTSNNAATNETVEASEIKVATAGSDIRTFALRQLEESSDIDSAQRLATSWNMDYVYDEKSIAAANKRRLENYLQWTDLQPNTSIPELSSTPKLLIENFDGMKECKVFGFDVEWGDESGGASLLQIATLTEVVLVDLPVLSETVEGTMALQQTVGTLFQSDSALLIGFGCQEDLRRLRSTPCATGNHWLKETGAVHDLQTLTGTDLNVKNPGLARCCEHYLGKPLDKLEQCSQWSKRPLSNSQRVYAALDAHVCALIFHKHFADRFLTSQCDSAKRRKNGIT